MEYIPKSFERCGRKRPYHFLQADKIESNHWLSITRTIILLLNFSGSGCLIQALCVLLAVLFISSFTSSSLKWILNLDKSIATFWNASFNDKKWSIILLCNKYNNRNRSEPHWAKKKRDSCDMRKDFYPYSSRMK